MTTDGTKQASVSISIKLADDNQPTDEAHERNRTAIHLATEFHLSASWVVHESHRSWFRHIAACTEHQEMTPLADSWLLRPRKTVTQTLFNWRRIASQYQIEFASIAVDHSVSGIDQQTLQLLAECDVVGIRADRPTGAREEEVAAPENLSAGVTVLPINLSIPRPHWSWEGKFHQLQRLLNRPAESAPPLHIAVDLSGSNRRSFATPRTCQRIASLLGEYQRSGRIQLITLGALARQRQQGSPQNRGQSILRARAA